MAIIIDPRYKMVLVNYYYPKIYVASLESQLKRVCEFCDKMVNYYEAKFTITRYSIISESFILNVVSSDFDDVDDIGYANVFGT